MIQDTLQNYATLWYETDIAKWYDLMILKHDATLLYETGFFSWHKKKHYNGM